MPRPAALPLPFHAAPTVVGMVHLPALPGAPAFMRGHPGSGDCARILERVRADASALARGGVDGIVVENFGDVPFHAGAVPPETVAALTLAVAEARSAAPGLPVGVNVLRNDARAALGIAAATGAAFVRVNVHTGTMWTDQGAITGRAHETLRVRATLCPHVAILADVHVKHATPPAGEALEDAARDAWHRGLADALIVSGAATGAATDPARVARVAAAVPGAPLWVGSGADPDSVLELEAAGATGFIVGSAFEEGGEAGAPVDEARVRTLVRVLATPRG